MLKLFGKVRFEMIQSKSSKLILAFFEGKELKNFREEFTNLAVWEEFIPNLNPYTEILSSGNSRMISNSKIKSELLRCILPMKSLKYIKIISDVNMRNTYMTLFLITIAFPQAT